jgi:phosphonate transport system substrate-binding protein
MDSSYGLKKREGGRVGAVNAKSIKRVVTVLFFVLLVAGCMAPQQNGDKKPVDSRPILHMGAVPSESADKIEDQYQAFVAYLERQLGYRVVLVVETNYQGIIRKMRDKELDIAFFGPYSYIDAHAVAGARAFVTAEYRRTGSAYQSLIITHVETGIRSLSGLKGHSFAFVDKKSTSGYLLPQSALMKQGIDPQRDFAKVVYAGHHDAAVLAVNKRTVDAAAVSSNILKSLLEKGIVDETLIRVLYASPPVPQSAWAYREGISDDLVARIKQAFLQAHSEKGALGLYEKDVVRFVATDDSAYDIIREPAKQLKNR